MTASHQSRINAVQRPRANPTNIRAPRQKDDTLWPQRCIPTRMRQSDVLRQRADTVNFVSARRRRHIQRPHQEVQTRWLAVELCAFAEDVMQHPSHLRPAFRFAKPVPGLDDADELAGTDARGEGQE